MAVWLTIILAFATVAVFGQTDNDLSFKIESFRCEHMDEPMPMPVGFNGVITFTADSILFDSIL